MVSTWPDEAENGKHEDVNKVWLLLLNWISNRLAAADVLRQAQLVNSAAVVGEK